MSTGVDTRPVPVSLLRWPRTRDLVTQYKGILMYLWAHPEQTACGCYLLPLDATAADLSMSSSSLADALVEFSRRKLVDLDHMTGEILLPDWFRWYRPRTPAACGAVESSIRKILSPDLREKVEKSYKSIAPPWKGKEKVKVKEVASRTSAGEPADAAAAPYQQKQQIKRRIVRPSGIVTWTCDDLPEAERIERQYVAADIASAVASVEATGKDPVPGLIVRKIDQQLREREAVERQSAADAAYQARLASPDLIDPTVLAKGQAALAKIAKTRAARQATLPMETA